MIDVPLNFRIIDMTFSGYHSLMLEMGYPVSCDPRISLDYTNNISMAYSGYRQ